jgi:branched-chain amino acid transport system permease protein
VGLLATHNLLSSRSGRSIRCLRGRALVAESFGADTARLRITIFVYAAVLAGSAGWLYAHLVRFVNPTPFNLNGSLEYLFMAVLGGISSIWGAVIGAGLLTVIRDRLQDLLPNLVGSGGAVETITFGLLVLLLLQWTKTGIAGWLSGWMPPMAPMVVSPNARALPRRARLEPGRILLELRDISRHFGGLVALDKVSFCLRSGEILALIGPNGAGKSTLFDIATGVREPSGGSILFNDARIDGMKARDIARLGVARTFQHVKLRSDMSVIENVAVGAYLRSNDGPLRSILRLDRTSEASIASEAARMVERVGLKALADQPAGSISLGQQRLVEIARALASDPYLLLLDEPAAGLRWNEKRALGALLRQLKTEGVTILIVEHDMRFVMSLVDRVVVLNFGRKIADGSPENVRADDAVLKAYLGTAHATNP